MTNLQQAIASGQVSAAQIEAHYDAGELPDCKPKIKMKLKRESFGKPAGTEVFKCQKYDYGLARDDTNMTGVDHISVSLNPDGDYPSFSVPEADIERTGHDKELPIVMFEPRFQHTYCSQCGRDCGPGDEGFSSCHSHQVRDLAAGVIPMAQPEKVSNPQTLREMCDAEFGDWVNVPVADLRAALLDAERYRFHRTIGGRSWSNTSTGELAKLRFYDSATDAAIKATS